MKCKKLHSSRLKKLASQPVRSAHQPPVAVLFSQNSHQQSASNTFLSEQPPAISQQYFSFKTNQHQPSATSETKRL
jgi:hypothetical protein